MSTDHPELPPNQDILWHQAAIATERIILAGEEAAMRTYGVGTMALFALGAHSIATNKSHLLK